MPARRSLVLLVAVVLAACRLPWDAPATPDTPVAPADQVLNVDAGGPIATLDPALQQSKPEYAAAALYGEPLLLPAGPGAVRPAAAASYDVSADGLTYTFHLRPDGRFSDGSPVVAADFVFAWRRLLDPRVGSPHADLFASAVSGGLEAEALHPCCAGAAIDAALNALGLHAPDPHTFTVTLVQPEGWFRVLATLWAGVPLRPEAAAGAGWADRPGGLVTNGPFRVTEVVAGDHVTVEANLSHPGPQPRLRQIVLHEISDPVAAYDRYILGRLDVTAAPSAQVTRGQTPGAHPARDLITQPQPSEHWITFNTTRAPFDNPALRRAFAAAVDPSAYVRSLPGEAGPALPATGPVPLGVPGHEAQSSPYAGAGARALLDASGVAASDLMDVHLLVEATATGRALAATVQQQVHANLGVDVRVDVVARKDLDTRRAARDYDMTGPLGWTADGLDPNQWFDVFRTSDGNDVGRWSDDLYDRLVGLADGAQPGPARDAAYAQALARLVAGAPVIFLDQAVTAVLVKPRVRGLRASAADPAPFIGALSAASIYIVRG